MAGAMPSSGEFRKTLGCRQVLSAGPRQRLLPETAVSGNRRAGRARGCLALVTCVVALFLPGASTANWLSPQWRSHSGHVLVIGDSHTWFAGAGRQYPRWDTSCRPGRDSGEGLRYLRAYIKRRHRQVIFDLGTNDWPRVSRFKQNVRKALRAVGRRDLYLVTAATWNPVSVDGGSIDRIDAFIRRLSQRRRRVHLIDWEAQARHRWFLEDGVHFTDEGYAMRTRLIKAALWR
jgi:lysophospholipase L1-like esterase